MSNEIGMGLHADTHIGRKFTELQGWMNQYIAKKRYSGTYGFRNSSNNKRLIMNF
jgi:adenosyl cobinamide kinase/adenosyl cobinamide phosphate guanylyltransferase